MPNKQNETQLSKIKTNVQRLALAAGAAGSVEWACATATNVQAQTRLAGLLAADATNGLPAKYAPSECR